MKVAGQTAELEADFNVFGGRVAVFIQLMHEGWRLLLPFSVIIILVIAACSDWQTRIIPNWLSIVIIAAFLGYDFSENGGLFIGPHLLVAIGVLIFLLPLFAFGKMGGGDIKLIASLAIWIGPLSIFDFVVLVSLMGGLLAVTYLCVGRIVQMQFVFAKFWIGFQSGKIGFQEGIPYGVAISISGIYFIYNQHVRGAM